MTSNTIVLATPSTDGQVDDLISQAQQIYSELLETENVAIAAAYNALDLARILGGFLLNLKNSCAYGTWNEVRARIVNPVTSQPLAARTASRYMRIFSNWESVKELPSISQAVEKLSKKDSNSDSEKVKPAENFSTQKQLESGTSDQPTHADLSSGKPSLILQSEGEKTVTPVDSLRFDLDVSRQRIEVLELLLDRASKLLSRYSDQPTVAALITEILEILDSEKR